MSHQIIQCPTNIHDRREGVYGSTWVIVKTDHSKYVNVYHSVCSPDDQFSRKKGHLRALVNTAKLVHKASLPDYVQSIVRKGTYLVPTTDQIYQAIVRL